MIHCNQVCIYNFADDGCLKPGYATCPMSNIAKDTNVLTNADHIRSMTDDDMADFISEHSIEGFCCLVCDGICEAYATLEKSAGEVCREIIAEWLKQPYKEEA